MDSVFNINLKDYTDRVASDSSTPGGGNVIASVNSLAASLMLMALRIAVLNKDEITEKNMQLQKKLMNIKSKSLKLADRDSIAFKKVMEVWNGASHIREKALIDAAEASLDISDAALALIELINDQELKIFKKIISDVSISYRLANSALKGGLSNAAVNLKLLKESAKDSGIDKRIKDIKSRFRKAEKELNKKFKKFIKT